MPYKLRVILDVDQDVIRDLIIDESRNLEDLHFLIARAFGFKGQEMAAFYRSNDNWEQGEEIPLFDMSEDGNSFSMKSFESRDVFNNVGDKMIYVYDFFSMWTFYIELSDILDETDKELPFITLSMGNPPESAPEKEFTAMDAFEGLDPLDDSSDFESLDDLDYEY